MVFSAPNLLFVVCVTFSLVFGIFCSYLFRMSLLPFVNVFHGVLLLFSSCAARHFGLVFHIFYILCGPCFFCMRAPSHILQFFASLFTFVVAYIFFSATSSSIRKFSYLFLCLFVNVIEVKTLVFSSLFLGPFCFLVFYSLGILKRCESVKLSIASTHGTCFYHQFSWFEFRIHDHGISVMFCLQLSVRDVHTWGLLNGRRPLSSCYLELVIRGSMCQPPGLFSTFQIYSAFTICYQFYGLIVIYAGSSRLYLVSRKSAHRFVLVVFFLCFTRFEKYVVIS